MKLAVAHHRAGRLAEALRLYRNVLKSIPDHPDTNHNLGVLLIRGGQPESGIRHLKTALEVLPSRGQYWLSYIDALIRAGHAEAAAAVMAQGKQYGLQGAAADRLAARLDSAMGSAQPAFGANLDFCIRIKEPPRAEIEAVVGLFNSGKLGESCVLAAQLIGRYPDYMYAWHILGASQKRLGQLDLAEATYRKALALKPDFPEALNNLANILRSTGRLEESIGYYRRALESKPDYVEALSNLGVALNDRGAYVEAEILCRRALALNPDYGLAHNNLGNCLRSAGKLDAAAACCREALRHMPEHAEINNNLAAILHDLGQLEEALQCSRKAVTANPDCAEALNNLASILHQMGRLQEALETCQRAIALKPQLAIAYVTLAVIQSARGQFGLAEAALDQALKISPEMPSAICNRTTLRKMTLADASWVEQAKGMLGKELAPKARYQLHYAIGKYCDDTRDYDNAFAHYRQGNALKKRIRPSYGRELREQKTSRLIETFDRMLMQQLLPGSSSSMLPVFIVGLPRSGTSLTEQILASHPQVFGAGELVFWKDAADQAEKGALQEVLRPDRLNQLASACLDNLCSRATQAARIVDKMPANFLALGLIHAAFPNARILHTQRNPIDNCLSIHFQDFSQGHAYAHDLDDLAHYYRQYHRLMAHWREVLPAGVLLDVPYEALVEDQEGWSRKIIEFIGLEWDERCLDFHKTERRVGTASNWQARQPIYKTSKERWRNYEEFVGPLLPLLELYNPTKGVL